MGRHKRSTVHNNAPDASPDAGRGRPLRDGGWLDVAARPFASGASRHAYRARVRDGCARGFTEGAYCVVKAFKHEYGSYGYAVSQADVDMQAYAARLADEFRTLHNAPRKGGHRCPVYVRHAELGRFEQDVFDEHGNRVAAAGDALLCEREIRGEFTKFNSNTGWSSGADPIADAFSHWTWHATRGEALVCDLQGHRGGADSGGVSLGGAHGFYYLLTDPAINSREQRFGFNDMGQAGIERWFSAHVCGDACRALGLQGARPRVTAAAHGVRVARATTYSGAASSQPVYAHDGYDAHDEGLFYGSDDFTFDMMHHLPTFDEDEDGGGYLMIETDACAEWQGVR
jgi:hypothetical protein